MKKQFQLYKTMIFCTLTVAASIALAATERTPTSSKDYTFKFHYKSENLTIQTRSNSWEDAYQLASQQCFSKLSKNKQLSEDIGMDIIDVCANPR